MKENSYGTIFNAYPDSIGGRLCNIADLLEQPEFADVFRSFYILPSVFNTDLDRGFSVIDYEINKTLAENSDLERLRRDRIELFLDFVLNHISVLSPQFQDVLQKGEASKYRDFFINWNRFWAGKGEMTGDGYILPDHKLTKDMFFRKQGSPILMARFPDGREVPYWNTFYQAVCYPEVPPAELVCKLGLQYGVAEAEKALRLRHDSRTVGCVCICIQGTRSKKLSE